MNTLRIRWPGLIGSIILSYLFAIPMDAWSDNVDVDAAKKEGKVVVYGTVPTKDMDSINNAFEKKYGIKVEYWRAASGKIIDRTLTEWRGGRPGFDVVEGPHGMQMILRQEGFYAGFVPVTASKFPRELMDKDGLLTVWRTLPIGILYNKDLVKPTEAPKDFADLLNPKWEKKIGLADPSRNTTSAEILVNMNKYFDKKAEDWVKLLAKQEPYLVESLLPVGNVIASGEVLVGISFIKYLRQVKGPLDYVRLEKYLANSNDFGLSKRAPQPNAGKLYIEFACSTDAQRMIAKTGEFPLSPEASPPIDGADKIQQRTVLMDVLSVEGFKAVQKKYREIFFTGK